MNEKRKQEAKDAFCHLIDNLPPDQSVLIQSESGMKTTIDGGIINRTPNGKQCTVFIFAPTVKLDSEREIVDILTHTFVK